MSDGQDGKEIRFTEEQAKVILDAFRDIESEEYEVPGSSQEQGDGTADADGTATLSLSTVLSAHSQGPLFELVFVVHRHLNQKYLDGAGNRAFISGPLMTLLRSLSADSATSVLTEVKKDSDLSNPQEMQASVARITSIDLTRHPADLPPLAIPEPYLSFNAIDRIKAPDQWHVSGLLPFLTSGIFAVREYAISAVGEPGCHNRTED